MHKDRFRELMFKGERFPGGELPDGAVAFNGEPPAGILTCCPCGCGSVSILPFPGAEPGRQGWVWDGNRDAPTLSPSVHHVGHWHGFLQKGFWVQA